MKIKGKNMLIKKDVNSVSIYDFCMISKNKDFRYLIRNFNEDDEDSYLEYRHDSDLMTIYAELVKEHKVLTDDIKSLRRSKADFEISELKLRYSIASRLLDIYNESSEIEVLECFPDLGYAFNKFELVGPQLDSILKALIGLKNTIKIKEVNFKHKYKISDEEEDDDESYDLIKDLDAKALSLEAELELGYKINVKKTSILRWTNLINRSELKRQANGKSKH